MISNSKDRDFMITVYGDILFAVNFFMDFLLLRLTGLVCGKTSFLRSFAGALIGAIYATTTFFLTMPVILSVVLQFGLGVAMVAVTFGIKQNFRLKFFTFIGVSIFCGGIVLLVFLNGGAFIVNGTVYFSAPARKLLFSSVGCYYAFKFLGTLIDRLTDRRFSKMQIKIVYGDKNISCVAMCDSGNSLTEPFTALPVCVLHRSLYNELFSEGTKLYIIPYKTISGENRVMTGFKPDSVTVTDISGKAFFPECIVAVTDTEIKKGTEAIISPLMLTGEHPDEQTKPLEKLYTFENKSAI